RGGAHSGRADRRFVRRRPRHYQRGRRLRDPVARPVANAAYHAGRSRGSRALRRQSRGAQSGGRTRNSSHVLASRDRKDDAVGSGRKRSWSQNVTRTFTACAPDSRERTPGICVRSFALPMTSPGARHMPAVRFAVSLVLAISLAPIAYAQAPTRQPPPAAPGAPARQAPAAPAEAPRPVGSEPEATTATYGDWVMRCQRIAAANATQRVCEVAQSVQAQGQQNPILQVALGSLGAKEPIKLTIVAPVNVSFPSVV